MPKEFTHLAISIKALEAIEAKMPELGKKLRDHYKIFMLGTLICDGPYYQFPPLNISRDITYLSKKIHTQKGSIDRGFFYRLLKNKENLDNEAYFAFTCGILSHHIADMTFHPSIAYFTGDYSEVDRGKRRASQSRHRFLEGLIDLWAAGNICNKNLKNLRLSSYISLDYSTLSPYLSAFTAAIIDIDDGHGAEIISRRLHKAMKIESLLVSLYGRDRTRRFLLALNRLSSHKISNFSALWYPDEKELELDLFRGQFIYRDPFSGDEREASMEGLLSDAIERLSSCISEGYINGDLAKAPSLPDLFDDPAEDNPPLQFTDTSLIDKALSGFLNG